MTNEKKRKKKERKKQRWVKRPTHSWNFEIHVNEREISDEAQNDDKQSEGTASARILDNWCQQKVETGQQHDHWHHYRNLGTETGSGQVRSGQV